MRYIDINDILTEARFSQLIKALRNTASFDKSAAYFLASIVNGKTVFETEKAIELFRISGVFDGFK